MIELSDRHRAILTFLEENGGSLTRDVAVLAWKRSGGLTGAMRSAWALTDLVELERRALVRRMDNQKPICWCRTPEGTAAIEIASDGDSAAAR